MNNDKCILINENTELYDVIANEDYIHIKFCKMLRIYYNRNVEHYNISGLSIENVYDENYSILSGYDNIGDIIFSINIYDYSQISITELDGDVYIDYINCKNPRFNILKYPIITDIKINEYSYQYEAEIYGYLSNLDKNEIKFTSVSDPDFYLLMSKISISRNIIVNSINKTIGISSYLLTESNVFFINNIDSIGNIYYTDIITNESSSILLLSVLLNTDHIKCVDSGTTLIIDNEYDEKLMYNNNGKIKDENTIDKSNEIIDIITGPIYNDLISAINNLSLLINCDIDEFEADRIKSYIEDIEVSIEDIQNNSVIKEFNLSIIAILNGTVYRLDRSFFESVKFIINKAKSII